MFTLGLAGGLDAVHEQILDTPENYTYDGAAVLIEDGVVVAAMEQERVDRIQHSNKFPTQAARFCLESCGLRMSDVSTIAYYVDEPTANSLLTRMYLNSQVFPKPLDARSLMRIILRRELGCDVDPSRLRFYEHKLTHAASAIHHSGFTEGLVYVIDNAGGVYAGRRNDAGSVSMETIALIEPARSLQKLCHSLLPYFGLGLFEEYKALALSTYGNPATFERLVASLYDLLPNGEYTLHLRRAEQLLIKIEPPRAGAALSTRHNDLAAALQQAMERIVLHVLAHHRAITGLRKLCVAGGMAENTWTNSAILYSGLFDDVFVHPAAYDAGCALGAALLASQDAGSPAPRTRVKGVNWGSEVGESGHVAAQLAGWSGFLRMEKSNDIARRTAALIAQGALIAWVQDRSHFGTHALGSRNVLADPRPANNRERLHQALNRAESYRPFAAVIREDDLTDWCEVPAGFGPFPFQTFAVSVRPNRRNDLGAAVHPDGKARVQTITRDTQPALWRLLSEFDHLTGCSALLSASFNRGGEPTVESIDDAAACFLCADLDYLVIADWIIEKVEPTLDARASLLIALPPYVQLVRRKGLAERRRREMGDELRVTFGSGFCKPISRALACVLTELDEKMPVRELLSRANLDPGGECRLMDEIMALWSARLVVLRPDAAWAGAA